MRRLLGSLSRSPLLVQVLWGFAFAGIGIALRGGMDPLAVVALRTTLAGVGFLVLFATGLVRYRPLPKRDWPRLGLLVVCGVLIYHGALVVAQRHVPGRVATAVVATSAGWAYLLSIVTGQARPRWRGSLGVALATAGAAAVAGVDRIAVTGPGPLGWLALLLLSPLALATYTLAAKPLLRHGAANVTGQVFVLASIVAAPLLLVGGTQASLAAASPAACASVAALGLLSTLAAYTLWFRALETRPADEVAVYLCLTPLLGSIWCWTLLGEPLGLRELIGGAAVMAGVAVLARAYRHGRG